MARPRLLPKLESTVAQLVETVSDLPAERLERLQMLTDFISANLHHREPVRLNFICTHNSRRSHIAQLWAQAAAWYFGVPDVSAFSGGTEATAFNSRSVKALQNAGFEISVESDGNNPVYRVSYSEHAPTLKAFSRKYDHPENPLEKFAAVMTCSHADENCPFILGAMKRIALTYDDPKDFDDTPQEAVKYRERVMEIGREILYAFSRIKTRHNEH